VITTKLGKQVRPSNFCHLSKLGVAGPACRRRGVLPPGHICSLPWMSIPRGAMRILRHSPDCRDDRCLQPSDQRHDFVSVEGARRAVRKATEHHNLPAPLLYLLLYSGLLRILRVAKVPLTGNSGAKGTRAPACKVTGMAIAQCWFTRACETLRSDCRVSTSSPTCRRPSRKRLNVTEQAGDQALDAGSAGRVSSHDWWRTRASRSMIPCWRLLPRSIPEPHPMVARRQHVRPFPRSS
jgi:hypothetical protein